MESRNSRNNIPSRGRSSLRLKRTDSPMAARPASVCDAKNHATEVRKSAICRGRSERVDGVELNAFNDSYSIDCIDRSSIFRVNLPSKPQSFTSFFLKKNDPRLLHPIPSTGKML